MQEPEDGVSLKAFQSEDADDLPEAIRRADKIAAEVKRWLLAQYAGLKRKISMPELERAIRSGYQEQVYEALHLRELIGDLKPGATERLKTTYMTGATVGAAALRRVGIGLIRFDHLDPHAVQWASRNAGRWVTEVDASQRDAVRVLVTRAQQFGRTVDQVARDLRDVVGLHSRQVAAVEKFRARLEARELDRDEIERRVGRYADTQLRARMEMIARTEVVSAGNAGQQGAWQEAVREGLLDRKTAYRKWLATHDDLLDTVICEEMDGKEVPLDEPWKLPNGEEIQLPQEAHPNCRCSEGLVIKAAEGEP